MNKPSISAVIMARNEEINIADAIATLSFASQIVVADTGSRDGTIELASKAGAEVHSIYFDGYGTSKNRALEYCKCDWILAIDADERISPELADNIVKTIDEEPRFDGYTISRLTYFLGKPVKHSGWYPDYVLRLFRNGKGRYNDRLVHEGLIIDGPAGKLKGLLHHYSYRDLESYMEKMNVYTSLNAQELYSTGKSASLFDILMHPMATFIKMYVLKAGFLDGFNGFLLAVLSSYNAVIKYGKLHELSRKGSEK